MSAKKEIQNLNNRIDKYKHKLAAAIERRDQSIIQQFEREMAKLEKQVAQLKHKESYDLNKERKELSDKPFSRPITKQEQADMGQLKRRVKGLVVVHPLTKLGKALRVDEVTGFADKEF
ncbi:YibL family ribosome-associated protein [Vibrio neonatus]|uniref:YibL family ribosome-associated protein n=1 Tax=Vibrio neonatus TaxID=278860 RepID=UPI0021C3C4D8|nr:YibL family ribosome-associated protein [Vibrio neonatus]